MCILSFLNSMQIQGHNEMYTDYCLHSVNVQFKGSMTHLQALQIVMIFLRCKWLLTLEEVVEVFELNTFQFRNKKQKWNPDFLLISLFAKSIALS